MVDKLLIATFSIRIGQKRSAINGMIEPLLSFFLPKVKKISLVDNAHPGSSTVLTQCEEYENETLVKTSHSMVSIILSPLLKLQNSNATHISFKMRDLLSTIEYGITSKTSYDLFIGLESVHTIAGIILKKLGKVKKVIYYVSDYSPNRYSNKLLNSIYLALDRFCCYNSDYVWDVSAAMLPARIKAGLKKKRSAPVISVPNALTPDQISHLPIKNRQPYSLVFVGTLGPENGPQLAIKTMPSILKKFPQTKLHIIGGDGNFEMYLKKFVKDHGLKRAVTFHGFLNSAQEVSTETKKYMIGLAPYTSDPNSPRWYADATKIRLYLGSGLPVITTHVPPLGKEVKKMGAAIITEDNIDELASVVIELFSNPQTYSKMSMQAIKYAQNNTWGNVYSDALKRSGLSGKSS